MTIKHFTVLRRRWPYWNWVVWERVTGPHPETVIVDEGLSFRHATAILRAGESMERLARMMPPAWVDEL